MRDVWQRDVWQVLAAAAVGAVTMYYLDPQQGTRRRAVVRDKAIAIASGATDVARAQGRHVADTVHGVVESGRARFGREDEPIDELTLHERVRACLGRVVNHPGSIHVDVSGRDVRLTGDVLSREERAVVKAVKRVRGVQHVENALTLHDSAAYVPSLQGADEGNGRWRGRLWPVLAVAAPLAILAVTARTEPMRRLYARLPSDWRPAMARSRPMERMKDYLSALRAS